MELPDDVLALYTAEIESRNGRPSIEIPERELAVGELDAGERYRIAVLPPRETESSRDNGDTSGRGRGRARTPARADGEPPVEEGEVREVEIEDVGDQGDGIARIGPGYVVFVPETNIGDRVKAEITQARENFAFAEVVEGEPLSN